MKFIIFLITLCTLNIARAGVNLRAEDVPCNEVSMGILAKDNMPYWHDPKNDPQSVHACYSTVTEILTTGSNMEINSLQNAVRRNVAIFTSDVEFAEFIHRKENSQVMFDPFAVLPDEANTQLPLNPPTTPLF